jgi:hypothetical protein
VTRKLSGVFVRFLLRPLQGSEHEALAPHSYASLPGVMIDAYSLRVIEGFVPKRLEG